MVVYLSKKKDKVEERPDCIDQGETRLHTIQMNNPK